MGTCGLEGRILAQRRREQAARRFTVLASLRCVPATRAPDPTGDPVSFFKRLFSTDPETLLAKAERAVDGGIPVEALNLLGRLPEALADELRARGEALRERAHSAVAQAASDRAADFEEAGMRQEEIDALTVALEHCRDDELRAGLQQRLARAKRPAREPWAEADAAAARAAAGGAASAGAGRSAGSDSTFGGNPGAALAPPSGGGLDGAAGTDDDSGAGADGHDDEHPRPSFGEGDGEGIEATYLTLVSILNEDVAERYENRPADFQQAYVDLNEGRAEQALPVFDELVRASPDDPVGTLERGRALLYLDRTEEAQADFETAWAALGDEPLDAPGALSLPILWSETAMELKQHEQVAERLAELGEPERGQPVLALFRGRALVALGRLDEAAELLRACVRAFPREATFPHVLAQVLVKQEDAEGAIGVLERAVAPACAGGGCRGPALHLPSARLLAGLLLDRGGSTERPRELLSFIAAGAGGRLGWEDFALLARCEKQDGDDEACGEWLARARAQVPAEREDVHALLDGLEAPRA